MIDIFFNAELIFNKNVQELQFVHTSLQFLSGYNFPDWKKPSQLIGNFPGFPIFSSISTNPAIVFDPPLQSKL